MGWPLYLWGRGERMWRESWLGSGLLRALGFVLAVCAVAALAGAEPGLAPLEDRVQWLAFEHELVAVDAAGGGEHRAPLGIGERVIATFSDGEVGVALTEQRVLAVTATTGGVHEVRLRRGERIVGAPMLGDRVALVFTNLRALGFDGGSGNWLEASLGPRERVTATAVANHVAAFTTDRRALGLSPRRGGFFEAPLTLREGAVTLSATGDLVTLRTRTRLLVFRAASGRWSERSIGLEH